MMEPRTLSPSAAPTRIGVDVGGTKIEAIALDAAGREIARRRMASPSHDYRALVAAVQGLVVALEARPGVGPGARVGVGAPGAVSRATGLMKNANSTVLNGRPFAADLAAALGREVRVENDANCFALSEAVDGAGAGYRTVFGVILGTGCGGSIVDDRRVRHGANAVAGEWGHNEMPSRTEPGLPDTACWCGRRRCIETYLSGPGLAADHARGLVATGALAAIGSERGQTGAVGASGASGAWRTPSSRTDPDTEPGSGLAPATLDAVAIAALALHGDPDAAATLARYANRLASALATVVNVLDPDVIVLGGGVSNIDALYPAVAARLPHHVFSDACTTPIVKHRHGDASGVRGAAWLWPADGAGSNG